jgi:hypothetical protein
VSRCTWDTSRRSLDFAYGPFTLFGGAFQNSSAIRTAAISRSRNPSRQAGTFRLFPVRSPLLRESLAFSFPQGIEMFHFPWFCFSGLCIQPEIIPITRDWVSPFGHLRIKVCLPLPGAYRSLPRPSSPSDAKAFTVRLYFA